MRLRLSLFTGVLLFVLVHQENQAQIPSCDIWWAPLDTGLHTWSHHFQPQYTPDWQLKKEAVNITGFYEYENQPAFLPDGNTVIYTSRTSANQTDLFTYNINTRASQQWMYTSESEYSPTVMPGGKSISCVVVEKDSAQRIWEFPLNGGKPKVLFPDIRDIGYHCWVNDSTCAVFRLGDTFTLHLLRKGTPGSQLLDANIGRCIKKIPGENAFSYVLKKNDSDWVIRRYDMQTEVATDLVPCLSGSEDYEWLPYTLHSSGLNPVIVSAKGNEFFLMENQYSPSWQSIFSLPYIHPGKIGRITFSPGYSHIAFVVNLPAP